MQTNRLEAFSNGVLAIIITIMVLELKVPHSADLSAIRPLLPVLLSYVLSFVYIGIYWNNHHHLLKAVQNTKAAMIGRIIICFSGFRSSHLRRPGWARTNSPRCHRRFMAGCSLWRP